MVEGVVVKICDSQTAQVSVVEIVKHPLYKKVVRKSKKFACQYEGIVLGCGDKVLIKESRPYSKMKKHVVVKKVIL